MGSRRKLHKAIEALKPKTPITDKKTAFWNAYNTVSSEYDKEFQQKYSSDLDTSLIFAGLFSAVTSAFIIQIQPDLQQDPNEETQALLRLLIHTVNASVLSGTETLIPQWTGPSTIIVVVETLLYISLFSTLLAALLAVLGKQWLLYYEAVGNRGTIDERGLERQRKFDGLRRWRFEPLIRIFPLFLQFSLLLFAIALSIYLWTIHHAIAGCVLSLTSLGIASYISLLASAMSSLDSPFRTPLSDFLVALIPTKRTLRDAVQRLAWMIYYFWSASRRVIQSGTRGILPCFSSSRPRMIIQESEWSNMASSTEIFQNLPPPCPLSCGF
ncbi:hypothetical protein B0H10DRAFT_741905 [Mycena sp. CBHHK59/15]|nr:hypothetical protein B0H10DRAFT_741905 [Mycena sp. CBHHK59/15]